MSQNSVEMVGHYGSDLTHALSAWTSTERTIDREKLGRVDKLLKFLNAGDNEHHTPFEKSDLHFLIRVEQATHIHALKHRIGVSINGESARYKELGEPTGYIPLDWPEEMREYLEVEYESSVMNYKHALRVLTPTLGRKRAKESARFFLLMSNQLTLDVSFNFRSFMHFMSLRGADDAQLEVNHLSWSMLEMVRETGDFPHSLAAFGY